MLLPGNLETMTIDEISGQQLVLHATIKGSLKMANVYNFSNLSIWKENPCVKKKTPTRTLEKLN